MKSAPEEKMAAEYFVSSYPHFVRVMKKFNISGSYTLVSSLGFIVPCLNICIHNQIYTFMCHRDKDASLTLVFNISIIIIIFFKL